MMNSELQIQFDKLEKSRLAVMQKISSLDSSKYQRSVNGKWSIGQILTHVITSEQLALSYMRKKSLGIDQLDNSGLFEPVKLLALKISQRLPLKYKVPKGIEAHTPKPFVFDELSNKWSADRQALRSFLENIEEKNARKKIFKHPIAGKFNAAQGLSFMNEHLLHHLPQINRLL